MKISCATLNAYDYTTPMFPPWTAKRLERYLRDVPTVSDRTEAQQVNVARRSVRRRNAAQLKMGRWFSSQKYSQRGKVHRSMLDCVAAVLLVTLNLVGGSSQGFRVIRGKTTHRRSPSRFHEFVVKAEKVVHTSRAGGWGMCIGC